MDERLKDSYDLVDRLAPEDRRQLMDYLSSQIASTSRAFSRDEEDIWELACAMSDGRKQRLPDFAKSYGRRRYSEQVELASHLLDSAGGKLRVPQRKELLRTLMECLVDHLRERNMPVLAKVLVDNLGMLRHAVEDAFPGYVDAGMLHKVIMVAA